MFLSWDCNHPDFDQAGLGALGESRFGLVNRKIRHKTRGEILFSHKEEKTQGGVV